jgi:hypothetical protein
MERKKFSKAFFGIESVFDTDYDLLATNSLQLPDSQPHAVFPTNTKA